MKNKSVKAQECIGRSYVPRWNTTFKYCYRPTYHSPKKNKKFLFHCQTTEDGLTSPAGTRDRKFKETGTMTEDNAN